jgi:hypothetical protein
VAPIPEFQVKVLWPLEICPGVGLIIDAGAACAMFVEAVAYFGTVPSIPVILTGYVPNPVFEEVATVSVAVPPTATVALLAPFISALEPSGPPDAVSVTLPSPALPFTLTVYCAVPPGDVVCGGDVEIEKVLPPAPTCKYG